MNRQETTWIAVDWGTTHLRVYAMNAAHQSITEAYSTDGMGSLQLNEFETALLKLIEGWLPEVGKIKVLACGMVGARQGWVEAAYQTLPFVADSTGGITQVATRDKRLDVHILPGLCQNDPADVMRGEETQIAGLLAEIKLTEASVCLPGTHSKWVALSNGQIQNFSTFMTGEMFALLSKHSILRHSVGTDGWEDSAFVEGVTASLEQPGLLMSNSFRIRAQGLLTDMSAAWAKSRLSGLLIGAELAGAKPYWSQQTVVLIGEPALSGLYALALQNLGVETRIYDPKAMTLAGLRQKMLILSESPDWSF